MVAERAADDLGRQRGAAHAEQDDVGDALVADLVGERLQLGEVLAHRVDDVSQPSRLATSGWPAGPHSVSSLRQMRRATSSSRGLLDARRPRAARRRSGSSASIDDGRWVTIAWRLVSMPSSSLSIGSTNFLDALAQQLVGDVDHVDARVGQRLQDGGGVLAGGVAADLGVVARRQQRGHGHRVDGVGARRFPRQQPS